MSREEFSHAWSVLCSRVITDKNSNNLNLDTVEQLTISAPTIPPGAPGVLYPYAIELVSLWHRSPSARPARHQARLRIEGPQKEVAATVLMDIDLLTSYRYRTIAKSPAVPVSGPGMYSFVVEAKLTSQWQEVARVPLEISFHPNEQIRSESPTGLAEGSAQYRAKKKRRGERNSRVKRK